jgi:hypothetical protein
MTPATTAIPHQPLPIKSMTEQMLEPLYGMCHGTSGTWLISRTRSRMSKLELYDIVDDDTEDEESAEEDKDEAAVDVDVDLEEEEEQQEEQESDDEESEDDHNMDED